MYVEPCNLKLITEVKREFIFLTQNTWILYRIFGFSCLETRNATAVSWPWPSVCKWMCFGSTEPGRRREHRGGCYQHGWERGVFAVGVSACACVSVSLWCSRTWAILCRKSRWQRLGKEPGLTDWDLLVLWRCWKFRIPEGEVRPALDWGGTKWHPGCHLVLCHESLWCGEAPSSISLPQWGLCNPVPQSPGVVARMPGKWPRQWVKGASQFLLSQPQLVMLLSSFKVLGAESRSVEQVALLKLLNIIAWKKNTRNFSFRWINHFFVLPLRSSLLINF